ncbi:MAG: GAF domain-containing protein [Deltaproteobacteria bacterium]|nr:GAF domain-containing protein [Deltaproteobacteria bacterium]
MAAFLRVGQDGEATVTSVRHADSSGGLRPGVRTDPGMNVLRLLREDHTVYEPDLRRARGDLVRALDEAGMGSATALPLALGGDLAGILVVARRAKSAFSSADCAFLHQLAEHVALAMHQISLVEEVRRAYDDLRATQQVAMQQERLRAMGRMASGVAHDINNALAPVTIHSESMLESQAGPDEKSRHRLETILAAGESIATTVGRMREFYRKRDEQAPFGPVRPGAVARQVLDLTRPRWHYYPPAVRRADRREGRDRGRGAGDPCGRGRYPGLTGWGTQSREEAGIGGLVDQVLSKPPRVARMREALARVRSRPVPSPPGSREGT